MRGGTYELLVEAMRERRQVVCLYHGKRRELCPAIIGTNAEGRRMVLAYQFGGESSQRFDKPQDRWRCFAVDEISDVQLRDGRWYAGTEHGQSQTCVRHVDYDVNPESPYSPKFRL